MYGFEYSIETRFFEADAEFRELCADQPYDVNNALRTKYGKDLGKQILAASDDTDIGYLYETPWPRFPAEALAKNLSELEELVLFWGEMCADEDANNMLRFREYVQDMIVHESQHLAMSGRRGMTGMYCGIELFLNETGDQTFRPFVHSYAPSAPYSKLARASVLLAPDVPSAGDIDSLASIGYTSPDEVMVRLRDRGFLPPAE